MNDEFIYILAVDNGYEGHSPPMQACRSIEEARGVQAVSSFNGYSSVKIYKVPVWPTVRQEPYYNIEQVQ